LKVVDVGLKAIAPPHLDGENMVVVLFSLLVRSVFGYLFEVVERMGAAESKTNPSHAFQTV